MSSEPTITTSVDTEETELTKPKRLPRSAKKRLRYERLRQHYHDVRKKKKKSKPSNITPSSNELLIASNDVTTKEGTYVPGKTYRRTGNERLAETNRDLEASVICIDCAYNTAMSIKELASLGRQIGRCYSSNRRATKPVKLILTNWSNDSRLAEECRRVNTGFDSYQIVLNDKPIHECYPTERLIYLSPNADEELTEINEQNIYVIGGLVDESVKKNMTYETCKEKNIVCYKLPIETYMEHSNTGGTYNKILSINQVFDILLTYISTKDWKQALKKSIPERKGWVVKTDKSDENKSIAE